MGVINSRLYEARKLLRLTQRDVAERAGVALRTYHRYESRESERDIPSSVLEFFAQSGINMNWLHTGEGPMLQEKEGMPRDEVADEVMSLMERMDDQGKQTVWEVAKLAEQKVQLEKKSTG